jgi:hypothetical protein
VREVTGFEDMLDEVFVLEALCIDFIKAVEGRSFPSTRSCTAATPTTKRRKAREFMLATGMTEDEVANLRVVKKDDD